MSARRLTDILQGGGGDDFRNTWTKTAAAGEFAPLPPGVYVAHVIGGELFTSRQNATPGYKITFKVIEGDHAGRQFWYDVWLTAAALPLAKRDLAKLGINSPEQLEQPIPQGFRCKVKVALRKDDDGTEYNKVRSFVVVGIDAPEVDPFAPVGQADGDNAHAQGEGADPETLPETPKDGIPL